MSLSQQCCLMPVALPNRTILLSYGPTTEQGLVIVQNEANVWAVFTMETDIIVNCAILPSENEAYVELPARPVALFLTHKKNGARKGCGWKTEQCDATSDSTPYSKSVTDSLLTSPFQPNSVDFEPQQSRF